MIRLAQFLVLQVLHRHRLGVTLARPEQDRIPAYRSLSFWICEYLRSELSRLGIISTMNMCALPSQVAYCDVSCQVGKAYNKIICNNKIIRVMVVYSIQLLVFFFHILILKMLRLRRQSEVVIIFTMSLFFFKNIYIYIYK